MTRRVDDYMTTWVYAYIVIWVYDCVGLKYFSLLAIAIIIVDPTQLLKNESTFIQYEGAKNYVIRQVRLY